MNTKHPFEWPVQTWTENIETARGGGQILAGKKKKGLRQYGWLCEEIMTSVTDAKRLLRRLGPDGGLEQCEQMLVWNHR